MTGAVGLESFVTALACLCASSQGPSMQNLSIFDYENKIVGELTKLDGSILQIFASSKSKFSFRNDESDCDSPDSEDIDLRLKSLEYNIKKQRSLSERLESQLKSLRASLTHDPGDKEEIEQLKSEVGKWKNECVKKDAEIKKLQDRIVSLERSTPKPPSKTQNTMNVCLLTKKHGLQDLKVSKTIQVWCDQKLDPKTYGEGWMLIAYRFNGSEHFFRNWNMYAEGFGSWQREFFIGLKTINTLTSNQQYELLIILTDKNNVTRYAYYDNFLIGNENEKFKLKYLGKFKGNAGDSLRYHMGQKFSTWDRDNDEHRDKCAVIHSGAWWYKSCYESNLFGVYENKRQEAINHPHNGMIWKSFHDTNGGNLFSMRMYLRPK